jgi:hypothetical protein
VEVFVELDSAGYQSLNAIFIRHACAPFRQSLAGVLFEPVSSFPLNEGLETFIVDENQFVCWV